MSKFRVDVQDMYYICKDGNTPLLSNYNATFWLEYRTNYVRYDKIFYRMFKSFKPFQEDPISYFDELTPKMKSDATTEFIEDVYNFLLINNKKYEELYRINVVNDLEYSILDNYNITETVEGEASKSSSTTYGEREDSKSNTNTYGAQTDERDISTTYGAKSTSKSESLGARQDSGSYTQGQQANVSTQQTAPYDDEDFFNKDKVTDNVGGRSDTSTNTTGAQSNSSSSSETAHTDTVSDDVTHSSHIDTLSESYTKGEQEDSSSSESTNSSTMTRKGNIGVKTATEVMAEHEHFWKAYEFYIQIFKDIARELLIV